MILQGMKNDPVAVPDRQNAFAMPRRLLKYLATKMIPAKNCNKANPIKSQFNLFSLSLM
jgi:hypothetical protein